MKDRKDVITEFNSLVNMTAPDLESWLKSDDSNSAGWSKDDGETVGHDSGRKIVEILKANPGKKSDEYTDEQVEHMRKVVSYCKRHLAQESKGNSEKSEEELRKTKSYASLKNWGHDILKAKEGQSPANDSSNSHDKNEDASDNSTKNSTSNGKPKAKSKSPSQTPKRQTRSSTNDAKASDNGEEDEEGEGEKNEEENNEEEINEEEDESKQDNETGDDNDSKAKPGQKRKASNGKQNGAYKKQQTSKGAGVKKQSTDKETDADEDEEQDEVMVNGDDDGEAEDQQTNGKQASSKGQDQDQDQDQGDKTEAGEEDKEDETSSKGDSKNGPSKGDTVSWKWGNNHPEGKVLDVKEEDTSITTKNGNQVSRKGTRDDPAVVLDAGKSKAIKKAHELD